MKLRKAFIPILLAFLVLAQAVCPVCAAATAEEWNAYNSLLVTVSVGSDRSFATGDFPEVTCKAVAVAGKKTEGGKVLYDLILTTEEATAAELEEAAEALGKNALVVSAGRNELANLQSEILLNRDSLTLYIGQSAEVFAEKLFFYNASFECSGVAITVDTKVFDPENADKGGFDVDIRAGDTDGEYLVVSNSKSFDGRKSVEAVNHFLGLKGVKGAEVSRTYLPAGEIPGEEWSISGDAATMTLSGGERIMEDYFEGGVLVGQTATVKAVKKGKATLTLYRSNTDASATAVCSVEVREKGDFNGDGSVDNLDAANILKYDAGLVEMKQNIADGCDFNGDGATDNLDATLILRHDAGL